MRTTRHASGAKDYTPELLDVAAGLRLAGALWLLMSLALACFSSCAPEPAHADWSASWPAVQWQARLRGLCEPDTMRDDVSHYRVYSLQPSTFWETHRDSFLYCMNTRDMRYWNAHFPTVRAEIQPRFLFAVVTPSAVMPDSVRGIAVTAVDRAGNEGACPGYLWR